VDMNTSNELSNFSIIHARYLLVTFIPFYTDNNGDIWLAADWHRDVQRHIEYLQKLTIVAPRRAYAADIPNLLRLEVPVATELQFVALKSQDSLRQALCNLGHTVRTIDHEIRRADVLHSSIVGWPFPLGWVANTLALVHNCKLILVVESAPWRNAQTGYKHRLLSWLTERLGRFFMHRADLAIATQPSYLRTLRRPDSHGIEFVNPASWINDTEILPPQAMLQLWDAKRSVRPLKMLFAGRLVKDKGVELLLRAVDQLEAAEVPIHIDIIGEGKLRELCKSRASKVTSPFKFEVLDPVMYGEAFFALLRRYHVVLVPSLGDEQPRILFDAFAQGIQIGGLSDGHAQWQMRDVREVRWGGGAVGRWCGARFQNARTCPRGTKRPMPSRPSQRGPSTISVPRRNTLSTRPRKLRPSSSV